MNTDLNFVSDISLFPRQVRQTSVKIENFLYNNFTYLEIYNVSLSAFYHPVFHPDFSIQHPGSCLLHCSLVILTLAWIQLIQKNER